MLTESEFVVSMLDSKMSKLLTSENVQRVGSYVNKDGTVKHTKQSQQDTMLCDRDGELRFPFFCVTFFF